MRVLGVDPGTFRLGAGVVDSDDGTLSLVYAGVLTARKTDPLPRRLHELYEQLLRVIGDWKPAAVAIEEPFVARNVRAAMAVGQAQAIAMVAAAHCRLPVQGYSPGEVKRSVTDYGASSKGQVQEMVKVLLALPEGPLQPPDAADALAVAICHISASRERELASGR